MKELYSFEVKRKVKRGKSQKTIKNRVIVEKPSFEDVENGEFFYGQKFNELINAGFLTKAMLSKKMENLGGGIASETDLDNMQTLMRENIEASRVIEFYGEAKDLDDEQKEKLKNAEEAFISTQSQMHEYQTNLRDQYSQTADSKAEQKLIEWFVFNFSHYEDQIDDKKELFPIFQGETYEDKRRFFVHLTDEDEDIKDSDYQKAKEIFDLSHDTLIKVISIWFNKIGTDQKSIAKALKELFTEDEE